MPHPDAATLAQRLDGLPLALATAGMHLSQTADSCGQYLQLYNDSWNDPCHYSNDLFDYRSRSLYSTWNLSLTQIQKKDPIAVELLRLIAYLGNQDLWYELFQAGEEGENQPKWWSDVVNSRARFNRAMSTLQDYSLVDVKAGSYSLHPCVHDWALEHLNRESDNRLCRLAIHCVVQSTKWEMETDHQVKNRRLLPHVRRFEHARLQALIDWNDVEPRDLGRLACLYDELDITAAAVETFKLALQGLEKASGAEHESTLGVVANFGHLYCKQGKITEAEEMYMRALRGFEKMLGEEHESTLCTAYNLGHLYSDQGKIAEAEAMYTRALRGLEKVSGEEHMPTLYTVDNLGSLYFGQGKIVEAEEMCMRALRGYEKVLGAEHASALETVHRLGDIYDQQDKMAEAEEMYMRALRGYEKKPGAEECKSTFDTAHTLGQLYDQQDKMAEAEEMYVRALQGYEKSMGIDHPETKAVASDLDRLRAKDREARDRER